jgi:hypothetical protein
LGTFNVPISLTGGVLIRLTLRLVVGNLKPFKELFLFEMHALYSSSELFEVEFPKMLSGIDRTFVTCAVAVIGMLLHSPAGAEQDKTIIAALPATVSAQTDPAISKAVDYIRESNAAQQRQIRRNDIKPASQFKYARLHRGNDHVLILGGSDAIPM